MPTLTIPVMGSSKSEDELTGPQVAVQPGYNTTYESRLTYNKIRRMRKFPTIALLRQLFFAGIYAGSWSVVAESEEFEDAVQYVKDEIFPARRMILQSAAYGCFDFGWQPFEKVYGIDKGSLKLEKLKPLLQDITTILTDDDFELYEQTPTGAFMGFKQNLNVQTQNGLLDSRIVPLPKALLFNIDVEGTNWYGNSLMSNLEWPYDATESLQDTSNRFNEKMAGAHWVVYYPDGNSQFKGVTTPNSTIADSILSALRASGSIAVPLGKTQFQDLADGEANSWKIELITASGQAFPFGESFSYNDSLMARGAGFPERAILEGNFGTKAEAESHGHFAVGLLESRHAGFLETINWHLVNQMLTMQFGPKYENNVKIVASPIIDSKRMMLSGVYTEILKNPEGFLREIDNIDMDAIADQLEIPRIELDETSMRIAEDEEQETLTDDMIRRMIPSAGVA